MVQEKTGLSGIKNTYKGITLKGNKNILSLGQKEKQIMKNKILYSSVLFNKAAINHIWLWTTY